MQIPHKAPIALAGVVLVGIVTFVLIRPKGSDLFNGGKDLSSVEVGKVAKNVTVQIDGTNPGSGVLIKQQGNTYTVLTAAHVVESQDEYEVITPDKQRYPIDLKTIKRLPKVDLAILKFTSPQRYEIAEIGDSTQATEKVSSYVSGFRLKSAAGTETLYSFSPGQIYANASHPLDDGYALAYPNPTFRGMSGGPVLNQKGQLIGVHGRSLNHLAIPTSGGQKVLAADMKGGAFNLAIPVNTFLSLAPSVDSTLALRTVASVKGTQPFTAEDYFVRGAAKSIEGIEKFNRDFQAKQSNIATQGITNFDQALKDNDATVSQAMGGAMKEAIAQYDQAIQLNSNYASAYLGRAGLLMASGNYQKALQDCEQVIRIQPDSADAYQLRSGLRLMEPLMSGINEMLQSTVKNFQKGLNSANPTPKIKLDKKLLQKSLADSNEAIRLKPDEASFYLSRASVRIYLEDTQGAIADYQKAADLYKSLGDQTYYQLMMSYVNDLKRTKTSTDMSSPGYGAKK
jgi:S1-C subfamily serine protease